MKLKVSAPNASHIEAALATVNGKAARHCYTTFSEIEQVVVRAQNMLSKLLPHSAWVGAIYTSTSGGSVSKAYGYVRAGTTVTVYRGSSDWFIIGIGSTQLSATGGRSSLLLTQKQDALAVDRFRSAYNVAIS